MVLLSIFGFYIACHGYPVIGTIVGIWAALDMVTYCLKNA